MALLVIILILGIVSQLFSSFVVASCENQNRYINILNSVNPLPDDKILDSSKLKQSADDNFEFDENTRKLSQRVENTVGKGEIARYEQFVLFPLCFHKACFPGASKGVIVWEWVKGKR